MNGFLNLLKPPGMTSSDVVRRLKRRVSPDKIGHMGTLDPGAAGVLPIAVGRATRLFDYLLNKTKQYRAYFTFGIVTDTLDSYGRVTGQGGCDFSEGELLAAVRSLTGEIEQIPPGYSAVNVQGRRAYDLARKGEVFELPAKRVTVSDFSLIGRHSENTFIFDLTVSGGTYIRSLARDLAERLGTVGYMSALIRLRAGVFKIEDALLLEEVGDDIAPRLLSLDTVLSGAACYDADPILYDKLLNGVKMVLPDLLEDTFVVRCRGELFGLGRKDEAGRLELITNLRG